MSRVLINNYIKQSALLFISCGAALFAFSWVRVWIVSLLDMGQFATILDQFRDFERFAPIGFDSLFTYPGRVGLTFDEPVAVFCVIIWCISRGSDVVSGELGRGTLEMLLSQPVSRRQLLFSHACVSTVGLALLCLLVWAGIGVGISLTEVKETLPPPTVTVPYLEIDVPLQFGEPIRERFPLSDRVDVATYAAPTFALFCFGFFVLGMATMFSSMDRYRWRTVGVVVAIYVLQLIIFGLGKAAERLEWMQSCSFFSCYRPQKLVNLAVEKGLWAPWNWTESMPDAVFPPPVYPLLLLFGGLLFYWIALRKFERRDLPAPL